MRFNWKNSTAWIPLLDKTKGRRQTSATILKAFLEIYRDVTVFHAARPQDVQTYYRDGLRLADHIELTSVARGIFLSGEFPELNEDAFDAAVGGLSGIDNLRAYVSLDDREYIEHCGHYLIYGSEHICGIAAQLSRNNTQDYRQVLKRFGRPTVFQFSLPLNQVDESDLIELGELLHDCIRDVRAGKKPPVEDFTFLLQAPLSPKFILGHEHPTTIKDPLLPMQPYYHYGST
jgi:hypothetical protein